jgi:Putative transposase/Transposase zinc-binding domain
MIELAEVLRRHWPAYEAKYRQRLLPSHRAAVGAILSCRTPQRGGQVYGCRHCPHVHFAYHSCHHRACPKCGHAQATDWIARQQIKLLPVPYFLVGFTVPQALRGFIRSHQKLMYGLMFSESSATLQEIAAHPRYLGAELGMLGVLHTWGRQLIYHPHLHYVVPGAGLTPDGLRWLRVKDRDYFLTQSVLARRFRNRLRLRLEAEHQDLLKQIPALVWRQNWVVDVAPVGSGHAVLKYLSAYVYRTALSSQRIVADDERGVTFTYRDSQDNQWKLTTVSGEEFLRRFLQHILPRGFQRVRYFGWSAPAAKARWQRILALLDWSLPPLPPPTPTPVPTCPKCQVPMIWIARLARAPP